MEPSVHQIPLSFFISEMEENVYLLHRAVIYAPSKHQRGVLRLSSILALTPPELALSPLVSPTKRPPLPMPTTFMGPQVTHTSIQLAYKSGVPITPSPSLSICQDSPQNSGGRFIFWFVIKDTTQQQPNGSDARRVGRGTELVCPLQVHALPHLPVLTKLKPFEALA